MVCIEFMTEGDITVAGIPETYITYNNRCNILSVYTDADAPTRLHMSSREGAWGYLCKHYPLRGAYRRYHCEDSGMVWTEAGLVTPSEAF